jgi:alanine racemase
LDTAEQRAGAILTIDLDAVAANYRLLRDRVAPAECGVAVKADAYGLGAERVAPVLAAAGARTFFVALPDEALPLRCLLPDATIGVLGGLMPGCAADYAAHGLVPVLNHLADVDAWAAHARAAGTVLPAFLHVDTGMNRLGLDEGELAILAASPERMEGLRIRAVMSHLACADDAASPMTGQQLRRFRRALAVLPPAPASLANSSGIFRGRDLHFDLARPGVALYGVNPTPEAPNPMAHVVRLAGRVLQVRRIDSDGSVGYGATHRVVPGTKIATIAVGYADGYLRSLGGSGRVLFGDLAAAIVGRVSMDLITVDVTTLPDQRVRPGEFADIIGPHRSVDQVATEAGTIGYEILTALGRRYARRYVGGPQ